MLSRVSWTYVNWYRGLLWVFTGKICDPFLLAVLADLFSELCLWAHLAAGPAQIAGWRPESLLKFGSMIINV